MDRPAGNDVSQSEGTTTRAKPSLDEAVKSAVQSFQDSDSQPVPNADADEEVVEDEADDGAQAAAAAEDGQNEGGEPAPDAGQDVGTDDAEDSAESDADGKEAKGESDSEGAKQDTSEAASSTLEAPAKWPQDRKDEFNKLPDEAKKIVLAREAEYNKGFTEYAQKVQGEVKLAKDVRDSFTDNHRELMRASGLSEADAVREWAKLDDYYRRDPVAYVRSAIKHQQLTPEQVFPEYFGDESLDQEQEQGQDNSGETAQPPAPDPQLQTVQQQVGSIQQFLAEQVKQQQLSAVEQTINRLADERDESGNPTRPYFDEVIDDVIDVLGRDAKAGRVPAGQLDEYLSQAYEMAVYRRPDLRQKIIESQVESEVQNRLAQRQQDEEAEKARLAELQKQEEADKARKATTRKGSPGASSGKTRKAKMSLDEAVRAAVNSGGAA